MSEIDRATIKIDGDPSGAIEATEKAKSALKGLEEAAAQNRANLKEIGMPERASATDIAGVAPHNIAETAASYATITSGTIDATKAVSNMASAMTAARAASSALNGNLIGAASQLGKLVGAAGLWVTGLAAVVLGFEKWREKIEQANKAMGEALETSRRFVNETKGISERNVAEQKSIEQLAAALDSLDERYTELVNKAREPFLGSKDKRLIQQEKDAVVAVMSEREREEKRLQQKIGEIVAENERGLRSRRSIANKAARDAEDKEAREASDKRIKEEKAARAALSDEARTAEDANRVAALTGIDAIKEREIQAIAEINARRIKSNDEATDEYYKRLIEAAKQASKIQADAFAKEMAAAMRDAMRDVRAEAAAAFPTDQISSQIGDMVTTLRAIEARMQAGFQ